jgi:hypothetical protein
MLVALADSGQRFAGDGEIACTAARHVGGNARRPERCHTTPLIGEEIPIAAHGKMANLKN